MWPEFRGKVVLVTGAASGIGRASALAFARAGAKVVVADVQVEAGEKTAALARAENTDAIFVRADVSRRADVEAMIGTALEMYGRLDIAHNNAGISGPQALLADYPEEAWDQVIGINLKGVWLCMKYELQQMLRQGGGAIVNTSSTAGQAGSGGLGLRGEQTRHCRAHQGRRARICAQQYPDQCRVARHDPHPVD